MTHRPANQLGDLPRRVPGLDHRRPQGLALAERGGAGEPHGPAGHPFLNVQFSDSDDLHWTNTSYLPGSVTVVCFGTACKGGGEGLRTVYVSLMTRPLLRWCVRGGQGPHIIR